VRVCVKKKERKRGREEGKEREGREKEKERKRKKKRGRKRERDFIFLGGFFKNTLFAFEIESERERFQSGDIVTVKSCWCLQL